MNKAEGGFALNPADMLKFSRAFALLDPTGQANNLENNVSPYFLRILQKNCRYEETYNEEKENITTRQT